MTGKELIKGTETCFQHPNFFMVLLINLKKQLTLQLFKNQAY